MYSYVVTVQKATAVAHSLVCSFTGPNDRNLVICKGSTLEVHTVSATGLTADVEVNLFGKIASINSFRPHNSPKEVLFVLTEKKHFCLLGYDSSQKKIQSLATGNFKDRVSRPVEGPVKTEIDPAGRIIGMVLYEGLLKVLPIDGGSLRDAYNIRMEVLRFIDFKFLHGFNKPTVAILCEDLRKGICVKVFEVNLQEKELVVPGNFGTPVIVESSASRLVAVPSPTRGFLVVGEVVSYVPCGPNCSNSNVISQSIVLPPNTEIVSVGLIDEDGSRYLMGDQLGNLFVVVLTRQGPSAIVGSIVLANVGTVSIPHSISYLDNGVVFIGSVYGDSQLIRLRPTSDLSSDEPFLDVLEAYPNVGPIVDMTFIPSERPGQGHIMTCSGAFKDGSVRIIRSGIGVHEQASIDMDGIKCIWSLRESDDSLFDKFLVQAFMAETRVLSIQDEEMSEFIIPGMDHSQTSLYCANMASSIIVQVTPTSVRTIDGRTLQLVQEQRLSKRIQVATGNKRQLAVAVTGGELICFELDESTRQLKQTASCVFDQEIACLSIRPVSSSASAVEQAMVVEDLVDDTPCKTSAVGDYNAVQPSCPATLLSVGMWTDNTVRLLTLPSLEVVSITPLGVETQARDILLVTLSGVTYLMVGLGDGYLLTFVVDFSSGLPSLTDRKKVLLGSFPVSLACFSNTDSGDLCVFAASDRPTVIYVQGHSLSFSSVNTTLNEVNSMTPFHAELFPACLAISSESTLMIGTVDNIQKLHIDNVSLQQSPRRITYLKSSSIVAVCTEKSESTGYGGLSSGHVLLLEEGTMTIVYDHRLEPLEVPTSCGACRLGELVEGRDMDALKEYLVVGTAFLIPSEEEPTRGRILVFDVIPANLAVSGKAEVCLVSEVATEGAVFSITELNGRLAAGVSSKVHVFKWLQSSKSDESMPSDASCCLTPECSIQGNILALYLKSKGDFILVGDLLRSMTLLHYKPATLSEGSSGIIGTSNGTLEETCRDFACNAMRAIEIAGADGDFFVGADDFSNLFVLRRQLEATTEEERGKMASHAEYHIGDTVNVFRYGTLSSQPAEGKKGNADQSSILFGTVSGSLGCILLLSKESFHFLHLLERSIKAVTEGVGGLSHDDFRAFLNEMKSLRQRNVIDGDLVETILSMERKDLEAVVRHLNGNYTELAGPTEETAEMNCEIPPPPSASSTLLKKSSEITVEECLRRVDELARRH